MKKNNLSENKIMTWPREKAEYEKLKIRLDKLVKKQDEQLKRIVRILKKLARQKGLNKLEIEA